MSVKDGGQRGGEGGGTGREGLVFQVPDHARSRR